jgi:hypothetical protein
MACLEKREADQFYLDLKSDFYMELLEIKPVIRSILLALGRRATEREFLSEYFNIEGESFKDFLNSQKQSFFDFMRSIPDVCHITRSNDGEIWFERVSSEQTKHMDKLTIVKNKKKSRNFNNRFG